MFGTELIELIAFGKQLGIVLVGASALWGFVFLKLSKPKSKESAAAFKSIGNRLLLPLFGGAGIVVVFWFWLSGIIPVHAHEGIVLEPIRADIIKGLDVFFPLFVVWLLVTLVGLIWWAVKRQSFAKHLAWFFGVQFILATILASVPVWLGEFSKEQLFFIGHNGHSVFTFGTVLILDFLYMTSKNSAVLRSHVFPKFPLISKVVWVGLGFDFLSVALVFNTAVDLTPKFFFMQTVIAMLIINGVFLAGPIARRMVVQVQQTGRVLQKRWLLFADVAGAISIASWFSVTFVDFFKNITLQYSELFSLYLGLIAVLFVSHFLWEKVEPKFVKTNQM